MIDKMIIVFDKFINAVFIFFFMLIMFLGFYAVYDLHKVKDSAKLSEDIVNLHPKDNKNDYSFLDLKKINDDIIAWIQIYDTSIDYPIVFGTDNTEYLDKNYEKNFSITGSIFLDYRNKPDFSDDYSIIYGHNMRTGAMFSDVKKYENYNFFNNHLTGILYTETQIYKLEVICISQVSAYENNVFNIISFGNDNNVKNLEVLKSKASNQSNIIVEPGNKLLLLSTCDETRLNERDVLLAKMTPVSEDIGSYVPTVKDDTADNQLYNNENNQGSSNISISFKDILLLILLIFVIIIFSILIIKKIKIKKALKVKEEQDEDDELELI